MPSPTRNSEVKKIPVMGLLLTFALMLSYIESLIPFNFGIPGVKLGLANLSVVLALYLFGTKEALMLNLIRVLLAGFLFGNLYMIFYSMAGALCSFMAMVLFKKFDRFSMTGISMAGGVFHNIGQAMLAMWVVDTLGVLYYVPALLLAGTVAGTLNGLLAAVIRPYVNKIATPSMKRPWNGMKEH